MKNKISKYLCLPLMASAIILPIGLSSCSNNNKLVFYLSKSVNESRAKQFLTNIKENMIQINESYSNLNIDVEYVKNDIAKYQGLQNGSAAFAFLKVQSLMENNLYQSMNPTIQTLTTPFTFDANETKVYEDGSETDPLRIIANDITKQAFSTMPINWTDDTYGWNGIRYNKFYNEGVDPTPHYRGMILLSGSDEQIKAAKDAWNKKDFNAFRDLGIIVGNENSVGNYKLEELLIRKHFNDLGNNWTIASDRQQYKTKYKTDSYGTTEIGKDSNFVISFTDEGSFAWTHQKDGQKDYRPNNGSKIEALTVTNPSLYDIGTFSEYLDKQLVTDLTQSIYQLYEQDKNLYGAGLGYNGYKIIEDFNKEVVDVYNNTFNS